MIRVFFLVTQVAFSCGSVIFSLNGDDWMLSGPNNISVTAHVPGGVYTDLLRSKKIDNPYYRMNDVALRWVALANWTYTKTFQADDAFLKHNHIDLVCGGLDTVANVFLNDVPILQTDNMFRRYVTNVTKALKSGANILRVLFLSPVTYAEEKAKMHPYPVPPDCPPLVQHGECHFNFIRKEACSFSWDWGPSFPSMGIWRNITLEAYEGSVIRYITTETNFVSDVWQLRVVVLVDVDVNATWIEGTLKIAISEIGLTYSEPLKMPGGSFEQEVVVILPLAQVVERWWPNGLGPQKLYEMDVVLSNTLGDTDRRKIFVGFRTVELVQDMVGGDEPGYTFYFKINDVPVFVKGSNWIPADSFQEQIKPSYLGKLLASTVEANMNMLRVWGGGVYESEEFYALADRLGIMIWQDFMFACALYPVDADFMTTVMSEVRHQIRRLKRHPSIVIWSGNNENEGAIASNWFNIPQSKLGQYSEDYKKLYIEIIRNIVLFEDSTRPFVPSSPSNGLDTMEEGWIAKNPQSSFYGDIHYYTYEDNTWNWKTFPMPRFASEFGIQSWCSLETLAPVSLSIDWDIDSDFVWHRQHHDQGNQQILDEIAMNMPLMSSTNRTQNFINFIYLSQINQAVGIKTEVEFYRRSQNLLSNGLGMTMGALYWQLNDIWQGPTWASIEYGGKWKMLHYFAKRFFSRRLVSAFVEDDLMKVYYVNDDVWTNNTGPRFQRSVQDSNRTRTFGRSSGQIMELEKDDDVILMQKEHHTEKKKEEDVDIFLRIVCYHWDSLMEKRSWLIVFQKPKLAAKCIHVTRLSEKMEECECQDPSKCFFHFTGFIPGVQSAFPDNHLFLTKLSSVVGLERANVQVSWFYSFNVTFAKITLSTDHISPFTWLEAEGFSGRFSDNGFLMVSSEVQVTYTAWEPISDWQKFQERLTVRTFLDAYVDK